MIKTSMCTRNHLIYVSVFFNNHVKTFKSSYWGSIAACYEKQEPPFIFYLVFMEYLPEPYDELGIFVKPVFISY